MSQRTRAGLLALCLLAVLWGTAFFVPLPYVIYQPGPTVDILAEADGEETVQVTGHKAYYDDGELRMTTVFVSTPEEAVTLPELLQAYFAADDAVWPKSVGLRARGDRRVQRPRVGRRDGLVAGHRDRGRAHRARREARPDRRHRRRHARACRPRASSRCATC